MANIYEAYIVDSRSFERNRDNRPIWTHRLIATGVFTNQEEIKKWARKHSIPGGARCYIYKNGSNTLFDDYRVSRGKIFHNGFAFSIFMNKRPTTVVRR